MQIEKLNIKGFGNLENKSIEFKEGINLVQAPNETGKSTIVGFIKAMLYGASKNKNGNEYSEQERFKPWNEDASFSGSMEYTQGNKKYLLQRNFSSNTAKIYDESGEDISSQFNKTKTRGLEVGDAQLEMDEETFASTSYVEQTKLQISKEDQNSVVQRLTNMIQNGNESLSYEKAKGKIEKLLYDEVGTTRTVTKPKYICMKEIEELERKKDTLILNRKRQENIEERQKQLVVEVEKKQKEFDESRMVYNIKAKYEEEIQKEKFKFDTEKKVKEEARKQKQKETKKRKMIDASLITIGTIVLAISFLLIKEYIYMTLSLIIGIAAIIINNKISYKEEIEAESDNFDVVSEDIRKKRDKELKEISEKGFGNLYIDEKLSHLKNIIDEAQKKLNALDVESHKLKVEENAIKDSLSNLNEIMEELQSKKELLEEINNKEKIYNLAILQLDNAYIELKEQIIPEIEEKIKQSINDTTNGAYNDIKYHDKEGLLFRNQFGNYEKVNKLSNGTIDQMYLGFRLAMSNKYANVPLIFDETFVYFDDERLDNILKTIKQISKEKQIIILTCSSREKQALNRLNIEYNEVSIKEE